MTVLLVFTRYPEPGRAKTRLMGALGPEGAAELQTLMTRATLAAARRLAAPPVDALPLAARTRPTRRPVTVRVHFEGGDVARMEERFGADLPYLPQGTGDLGARLERAFDAAFDRGAPVVVIGADCPDLDEDYLRRALDALEYSPLVLGPARDGGYVLLGLRAPCAALFHSIPWSTPAVLRTTLERAHAAGLEPHLLPVRDDVDEPADLTRLATSIERLRARFGS